MYPMSVPFFLCYYFLFILTLMNYAIEPIGIVHSPFKEKFAVPRQPCLTPSVQAKIELFDLANNEEALRGIEQFSHLWILFLFDQNLSKGWSPTVRPPRLGGNERVGVFASRATFRPNGIGMSAVELKGITKKNGKLFINIGSCDFVHGTPVIDIKPYIPYSDAILHAQGGFAHEEPKTLPVIFTPTALAQSQKLKISQDQMRVIEEVLSQDPRPAYKKDKIDTKTYAVHLYDFNLKFQVNDGVVSIIEIEAFYLNKSDC